MAKKQSTCPKTSQTLLKDIAASSSSAKWYEFVVMYMPMMKAYLTKRFPNIDHDEVIQRTLITITEAIPNYKYDPKSTGLFHNYLTGILRHKALSYCDEIKTDKKHMQKIILETADDTGNSENNEISDKEMRYSAYELALNEFLANPSISTQSKEVFKRVSIAGESPASVAAAFGITRNNVDQIKSRSMLHLKKTVEKLLS